MQVGGGKRRRLVAEINVVPYIDVMLVLLVVFMITAPLLMQGVEVELPQAPSQPMEESEDQPILVSIKADGSLYIDLLDNPEEPRDIDEITDVISKVLAERPDTAILVWGDRNVAYGEVVGLMTRLQNAGTVRVGLVTEPPVLGN
jgi:biopolymer transport protein TolR